LGSTLTLGPPLHFYVSLSTVLHWSAYLVTHLVSTRPPSIRIILGPTGLHGVVEVNGQRLPGVRVVSVVGDVCGVTLVKLEMYAKDGVEVEVQAGLLQASVRTHDELLAGPLEPGATLTTDVTTMEHDHVVEAMRRG
jgi:hypothetical protein